ncbi:uncharacterized protein VTP21DRAFT_2357 [Calcarisporiella thermophila]|uniref:uncharacterized protein n=1 Tax=Calcarisporiella thermophila TaxID=911321 RepID=UPI003743319A
MSDDPAISRSVWQDSAPLDPWGQHPFDQEDLVKSIHFGKGGSAIESIGNSNADTKEKGTLDGWSKLMETGPLSPPSAVYSEGTRILESDLSTEANKSMALNFYQESSFDEFDDYLREEEDRHRQMMDTRGMEIDLGEIDLEEELGSETEFVWDKCLPTQMHVFTMDDIPNIINVVTGFSLPLRSRAHRHAPASILFLCARYAHYFGSPELLDELLESARNQISQILQSRKEDMALLSFWISNLIQLQVYLKKDNGLMGTTARYQLLLAEATYDAYIHFIRDAQRRLDIRLIPAMLEYDPVPGFENVQFEGEWQLFKRAPKPTTQVVSAFDQAIPSSQSKTSSDSSVPPRPPSPRQQAISPRAITTLLSSVYFVLESYGVPTVVCRQAISQLYYYVGSELFNQIITTRRYLCRSKAVQIRMNISALEDWARTNSIPSAYVIPHLTPLVQLLQLLQVFSQQSDFTQFIETLQGLSALNPMQLKRCASSYRYEVNEPRLPKECMVYLQQLAADALKARGKGGWSVNDLFRRRSKLESSGRKSVKKSGIKKGRMLEKALDATSESTASLTPPTSPSLVNSNSSADRIADGDKMGEKSSNGDGSTEPSQENKLETQSDLQEESKKKEKDRRQEGGEEEGGEEEADEEDEEYFGELKDSSYLLPFSVPITTLVKGDANSTAEAGLASSQEDKLEPDFYKPARRKKKIMREMAPFIPSDILERLGKSSHE